MSNSMIRRNIFANYLGQGWSAIMGLAFVPLYIKYLGIEAYGLIGIFAVLQAWLNILDVGMTPTLGREMGRYTGGGYSDHAIRDLLSSIETLAVVVALLMVIGVALGSSWLTSSWLSVGTLPSASVEQAFNIMGLVIALRFVESVYRSALLGLQRQVLFNVLAAAAATVRSLGAVAVLVWVSPTIEAFFLWQGATSLVLLVILRAYTYASFPKCGYSGRFSIDAVLSVWRFAGGMFGITMLSLLLTQLDKVMLSKLISLSEFGYYTLAVTVSGVLYMLIIPISQAVYPKFCQLHASNDLVTLANSYRNGSRLVTVIAGGAAIVLGMFSQLFLMLWTQDQELSNKVSVLLSLLVLGNFLNGLMWIPYQLQIAYGWVRLGLVVNSAAVILMVPAILWAVPKYGAIGAAWVWVVLNSLYVLIVPHVMHMEILPSIKWNWYLKDVFVTFLIPVLILVPVKLFAPEAEGAVGQIVTLTSAFILAIGGGLLALRLRFLNVLTT